jgi:hypothetical protein
MAAVSVLPTAGAAFDDVRDGGRTLRVAWHPSEEFFVLSVWRDGVCAGTSRLDRRAASALIATLVEHLALG